MATETTETPTATDDISTYLTRTISRARSPSPQSWQPILDLASRHHRCRRWDLAATDWTGPKRSTKSSPTSAIAIDDAQSSRRKSPKPSVLRARRFKPKPQIPKDIQFCPSPLKTAYFVLAQPPRHTARLPPPPRASLRTATGVASSQQQYIVTRENNATQATQRKLQVAKWKKKTSICVLYQGE